MSLTATILVIDDEPQIRKFLRISLASQGYKVIEAGTGNEGLAQAALSKPDLLVLDLGLPDMDGMDVRAAIRSWSAVSVIVLSARRQEEGIVAALDHGADDYVVKPFKPKELVARIHARLRRLEETANEVLTIGDLVVDLGAHSVSRNGTQIPVTPLEFDLLTALASRPGYAFSREQLLADVWGYQHAGDTRLVNVHVQRLRGKVELDPENPEVIVTVRGVGYRAGPP